MIEGLDCYMTYMLHRLLLTNFVLQRPRHLIYASGLLRRLAAKVLGDVFSALESAAN